MKKYTIGIVGATGLVGRTMLDILGEYNLNNIKIIPFASIRSAGATVYYNKTPLQVQLLNIENIKKSKCDFVLMSAGASVSTEYAPLFNHYGAVVIDNSSAWRMDKTVPLIVPEVNAHKISENHGIIANPNCSTIQSVVAIAPLHREYNIKRIIYNTYQAVSGAGIHGVNDLKNATIDKTKLEKFANPIYNNILPHIDVFLDNGYTKEEQKMIDETRKILDDSSIRITATAARVPVYNCHCVSINLEFYNTFKLGDIYKVLNNSSGVTVIDDYKNNLYPMPCTANNQDKVLVGRLRKDQSVKNGLNMWVVADNIRKGAATNAVQILLKLIDKKT